MKKLLFKYATRGRPNWFKQTLEGYYNNLSGLHDYEFRITIDEDDLSMNNPQMWAYMQNKKNLRYYVGPTGRTKMQAINADMENAVFDILVCVSDDMEVQVKNFDDIIVKDMEREFPTGFGALHYNDGTHGRDVLITLSILNKALYDKLGYIYHPDYISVWCDNEFMDVVKILKCYWYSPQVIIQHSWMKSGNDHIYVKNNKFYDIDHETYLRRKALNFGL